MSASSVKYYLLDIPDLSTKGLLKKIVWSGCLFDSRQNLEASYSQGKRGKNSKLIRMGQILGQT
jgi:hypothetical protein